jgi:N-methylhydantoinase B
MRALGPVIPDRVTAEWNELLCSLTTGIDPRKKAPYVDIGFMGLKGGSGAIQGFDGYDHIGMIDASGGVLDQDYEMFEQQTPHVLVKHEYWRDSAGPGRWRGGLGVETEFVIGSDNTKLVTFGDGDVEPARGAQEGLPGTLNKIELVYPDGREYLCTTKDLVENVPKATRYFQKAGGGGGYGSPLLRPASLVAQEVRNDIISLEAAARDYGVVVDPVTFAVNETETKMLRSALSKGGQ